MGGWSGTLALERVGLVAVRVGEGAGVEGRG